MSINSVSMAEAASDLRKKQVDALSFVALTGSAGEAASATVALGRLGFWIRDGRATIVEESDIPPLVALLTNGPNPRGRQEAMTALANIALNAAIRAKIVAAGGIAALVALLRKGTTGGQVTAVCVCDLAPALDSLARDNAANRAAIVDAAAVDPLVALLTNGSTGEQEQALRALTNFALCDTIREAIVDAGAIPPLVALVTSGAAGGQRGAVCVLENLATDNSRNQAAIVAAGAVGPLIALARDAESSRSLKDAVESALCALGLLSRPLDVLWQLQTLRDENASLKRRLDRVIAAAQASDSEEQPPQKRARG